MTPDDLTRVLLGQADDAREMLLAAGAASHWMADEPSHDWRQAEAQAQLAYEHWRRDPSADTYAVYRAARDRADAAQDGMDSSPCGADETSRDRASRRPARPS